MNKLNRCRLLNKQLYCHKNILSSIIHGKYFASVQAQEFRKPNVGKKHPPTYIDILLEHIPRPWPGSDNGIESRSDTTSAFKEWIEDKNLSDHDGKMLHKLKEHIINGGHPDFPRLSLKSTGAESARNGEQYYNNIDTECFKWLKKQKKMYRNKTIHPWLHWKLLQLNISLNWTREPLQDRHFKWIGYHDDVLSKEDTAGVVAESDPLFPLHSKEQPLLKFLNPFYELWYDSMPTTLKKLRLMNANKEAQNSLTDMDDIRATRIIKKWSNELKEWRYFIGQKDVDQTKIDEEILYNQQQESDESILRSGYLSNDIYDKNSYSESELKTFLKEAPSKPADEIAIEAMNYLRERETRKELADSFNAATVDAIYSRRQRAEYYLEALKRELIEAEHLNLKELVLMIQHLQLEYHPKQNPNAKKMTHWVPYPSPMKRKEAKTKWEDWNGNKPVEIYENEPQRYTNVEGVFDELDVYYKTRHRGSPPFGVWDIKEPSFDVEYFQIKIKSYLKCWRESFEGKQFIDKHLKREFDENNAKHVGLKNKLINGLQLLEKEKQNKSLQINDHKQFKHKFDSDPLFELQCNQKTIEIQRLQSECDKMQEIINNVYLYNDL